MTNLSHTQIRTRGYDVIIPTESVQAFLRLSHDDQVELADELNLVDFATAENQTNFDFDDVDPEEDTGSVTDLLIESMAVELDQQDQAIEAFADDREVLKSIILDERRAAFELATEAENLNDILLQTAQYVGRARELLAKLGIVIETDGVGQPVLVVNFDRVADAVFAAG